jgi:hypothetical protein
LPGDDGGVCVSIERIKAGSIEAETVKARSTDSGETCRLFEKHSSAALHNALPRTPQNPKDVPVSLASSGLANLLPWQSKVKLGREPDLSLALRPDNFPRRESV